MYNNKGGRINFGKTFQVDNNLCDADEFEQALEAEYQKSVKNPMQQYNYSFALLNSVNEIVDADMAHNFVGHVPFASTQAEKDEFEFVVKAAWKTERDRFANAIGGAILRS
jgi:hypothetical protein